MAKLKQLADSIQAGYQKRELWVDVERTIEQMTSEDFAVTYEKGTPFKDILLLQIIASPLRHLAESIINKNPVFAAKIVDEQGQTPLHYICGNFPTGEALKVVNLLLPYMSQEATTSVSSHGTFLHINSNVNYKIAAYLPPDLISIMLKNCSTFSNGHLHVSLIKILQEATRFYDSQISAHPEEADNYFKKGIILQGMGKNEKAIKCYQKAISLDPTYADKIEGIELSTLPAPGVVVTDTSVQDDRELMKAKISELTQELSKLLQKTTVLAEEVTFLRGSLKVVEEHKGQAPAEPPSYEEEAHVEAPALPASLPPDIALVGDISGGDTAAVVYHA